jgi:hypothetical protein
MAGLSTPGLTAGRQSSYDRLGGTMTAAKTADQGGETRTLAEVPGGGHTHIWVTIAWMILITCAIWFFEWLGWQQAVG